FSSRRRHTRCLSDWSSDVCSSDLVPLLFASGAGAVSRFSIGIVVIVGMLVGTLFTLFVVPAVYTFVAKDHNTASQSDRAQQLARSEERRVGKECRSWRTTGQ